MALTMGHTFPRSAGLALFGALGRLAFHVPNRESRKTVDHLRFIFSNSWSESQIRRTAADVWAGLGKNLFDAVKLKAMSDEEFDKVVKHDSLDEVRKAYNRGRGIVAVTAHIGCFEMLLHLWGRRGIRSFAIWEGAL